MLIICSTGLCEVCRYINFSNLAREELPRSHPISFRIGPLSSIIDRAHKTQCPFCCLVVDGFQAAWGIAYPEALLTTAGGKAVECVMRNRAVAVALTGNSTDGEDSNHKTPEYHENFAANEYDYSNCRITITASAAPTGCSDTVEIQNVPYQGDGFKIKGLFDDAVLFTRRSPEELESGVNFALLKKWIKHCRIKHGKSCQPTVRPRKENVTGGCWATFRVVDVEKSCVVNAEAEWNYVALSYVWGQTKPMLQLLIENKKKLYTPGALSSSGELGPLIPRTILDAMEAVRRLGERYIWIDALCICQNDYTIKIEVIQEMDLIYSSAMLTIVAASGSGANSGIPGILLGSRTVNRSEKSIILYDTPESRANELFPIKLSVARSRPAHAIDASIWNERGWTYQERLFSERLLIFTAEQVYFWCSEASWCEDTVLETDSLNVYFEDRPLFKYRIRNDPTLPFMKQLPESKSIPMFAEYAMSIKEFTKRQLSFAGDVLDASAGLRRAMTEAYQKSEDAKSYPEMKWLYGLPVVWFEIALLWLPSKVERRKVIARDGTVKIPFPSWSWAGWIGLLCYEYPEYAGSGTIREVHFYHFNFELNKLANIHSPSSNLDNPPHPPPSFYSPETSSTDFIKSPAVFESNIWHPDSAPTDPRLISSLLDSIPTFLLPQLLFFYTSTATFTIQLKSNGLEVQNNATNPTRQYLIVDCKGGYGSAFVDAEYIDARNTTKRRTPNWINKYGGAQPGRDEWNIEVVMISRRAAGKSNGEMGSLNFLVVERKTVIGTDGGEVVVRERVGFGLVSAEAWGRAERKWELVILG